ncbi:MAG: type II toxin-antitoxin system RelE/ParE family toxin [Blastocatellia bacterium]
MIYDVIIELSARRDIEQTCRWMERNLSPEAAGEWYLDIIKAIWSLDTSPARCALAFENQFFHEEIRQSLCGKYRILFEIGDDTVRILHVRHSARRPLKPKR